MISEHGVEHLRSHLPHISRRAFLVTLGGAFAAAVTGAYAIGRLDSSSPAAAPGLASGSGSTGPEQGTSGLRSVPADVKTAVSEVFTDEEPTTTLTRKLKDYIVTGNREGFKQMVSPELRYAPNRNYFLGLTPEDTAALRACENIPYQYLDELGPKLETRLVTILYKEPCVTRPSGKKVDRALFLWKKVSKEWYLTDYRL